MDNIFCVSAFLFNRLIAELIICPVEWILWEIWRKCYILAGTGNQYINIGISFGGGFELMRDAGDKEGFWTFMLNALK